MGLITGQFNESFTPIMDGVTNVVKNYTFWLNRKYGTSYAITPHFPNYVDQEDFNVVRYHSFRIPTRNPYRTGVPGLDMQFMRRIRMIPFDIVHAHCPFSSGKIALTTAHKRGIPMIASFHSKYYDDLLESLKIEGVARIWLKAIVDFYESADFVWTVNHATKGTLRDYGYKGHIEVVQNGTDFSPVRNRQTKEKEINASFGLRPNQFVFIFVGQLIWQKNLKVLMEAISHLNATGLDFKMLFVGKGVAEEELKKMNEELNLSDRVLFVGPIYDREYLKALYCRADCLLFPSVYDNASIVVREAASQGCPSLLIKGSNTAEGIQDNFNGFLSENSPKTIAKRIHSIASNRELLEQVGQNANQTIYVSWESIIDEVYGRYQEIVDYHKRIRA